MRPLRAGSLGAGILFLSTTRIEDFAYALTRLGMPYTVGFTMTMAFRLVPVFVDAATTVVQAQRCRGLDFERGGLWQRVLRYVPVMVPVWPCAPTACAPTAHMSVNAKTAAMALLQISKDRRTDRSGMSALRGGERAAALSTITMSTTVATIRVTSLRRQAALLNSHEPRSNRLSVRRRRRSR